jgi:transglutaminase-like putative cysteine protease
MQFGSAPRPAQRVGYLQIAEGKEGIRQTLLLMADIVRRYRANPAVLTKARALTQSLRQKDYYGEIRVLHEFVRDSIRYVKDPVGVETVATPDQTLAIGQGDCDDKAVLVASLLEALGHDCRFVAVGFTPGEFTHVLVQTRAGPGWVNVETTEPVALGWGPPGVRASYVVDI